VVSLAFFSLAAFERVKLGGGESLPVEVKEGVRQEVQREVAAALEEARNGGAPAEKLKVLEQVAQELEKRAEAGASTPEPGRKMDVSPEKSCEQIELPGSPRLQAALVEACRKNVADRGRGLWRSVAANIPRMMFVFLPLMALFLKAIYWRPRRYYVEHLVFFLHAHAAVFLVSIAAMAARALAHAFGAGGLAGLLGFVAWAYATWYVYRALRVTYGQGRALTLAKFLAIGVAYLTFLSVTLLGTVAISAAMAS